MDCRTPPATDLQMVQLHFAEVLATAISTGGTEHFLMRDTFNVRAGLCLVFPSNRIKGCTSDVACGPSHDCCRGRPDSIGTLWFGSCSLRCPGRHHYAYVRTRRRVLFENSGHEYQELSLRTCGIYQRLNGTALAAGALPPTCLRSFWAKRTGSQPRCRYQPEFSALTGRARPGNLARDAYIYGDWMETPDYRESEPLARVTARPGWGSPEPAGHCADMPAMLTGAYGRGLERTVSASMHIRGAVHGVGASSGVLDSLRIDGWSTRTVETTE